MENHVYESRLVEHILRCIGQVHTVIGSMAKEKTPQADEDCSTVNDADYSGFEIWKEHEEKRVAEARQSIRLL